MTNKTEQGIFMLANPLLDALPLMTERQQKFFYLLLSRLDWDKSKVTGKPVRSMSYDITISIKEFVEIFHDHTRYANADLKREVRELHNMIVVVENRYYREFIEKNPECIYPLIEFLEETGEMPPAEYLKKTEWSFPLIDLIAISNGKITVRLHELATPMFCYVTSDFTMSTIETISKLSDKGEVHLYLALKKLIVKNSAKKRYTLNQIRDLTLGEGSRKHLNEKNFKNIFLKKLITNIDKHTDINIKLEYVGGVYTFHVKNKITKNPYENIQIPELPIAKEGENMEDSILQAIYENYKMNRDSL